MGNAIWIFIGIAIIQAIVGGIAKSAEKRKKAEAAQRMLEQAQAGGVDAPAASAVETPAPKAAVARDTRSKSNSSAQRRLEELRKKRLEVLRRRSGPDAGVTAAIDPNARRARAAATTPTPPPPVAPTRTPAPARGASARVAEMKERRASTPPARGPQKTRRETRKADQDRRSDRQSAPTLTRPPAARKATRTPSTAKSLRGRLRTSKGFREALLLGELLKPPVGLRSPGGGPG